MQYQLIDNYLYIDINSLSAKTIQEFLDTYIKSSKFQHLLIQNKDILIDNQAVKREDILSGDKLMLKIYDDIKYENKNHYPLRVIYEDELCLVVYKYPKLLVHSDGNDKVTLTDYVNEYFNYGANPIHRLDYETQGLVFFSKSLIFQSYFDLELEYKRLKRNYIAIVKGKVDQKVVIDKPIGKDRHNSKKQVIYKKGKPAKTIIHPLKYNNDYSVVKAELKTGRTHQIRVHLSSINHPILNDDLYGVESDMFKDMGLIANELSFYHPLKEEFINIKCETIGEFDKYL